MADRTLADKQYKDGYQVLEGGDYLVHTQGTKFNGKHMVIRLADGTVMGEYSSREAANRRAQQLGGNSSRSRRIDLMERPSESFSWFRLNRQERHFSEAQEAALIANRAKVEIEKERKEERHYLATAGSSARAALAEHDVIDRTSFYSEIVSEATVLKRDPRFDTPKMKKYLRQFSLGPAIIRTEYGYAHAANSYRRAHVEAAWMALSEHDRVRRCRQHYVLATRLLDPTQTKLAPIRPLDAQAISRVLAEYPIEAALLESGTADGNIPDGVVDSVQAG
jgi:hypothetical protein